MRLYTPLIRHWVTRLGVESNHVHDLVQEVFMVLLGRVSWVAENPPNQFRAWLRTVTVNKCRDHFRRKGRSSEPQFSDQLEIAIQDPAAVLTEREYQIFVAQSAMQLMRDAFSETTWRACWENVVCGRSASDIAEEFEISENAVYLARGRVLKRLRAELDGLWD